MLVDRYTFQTPRGKDLATKGAHWAIAAAKDQNPIENRKKVIFASIDLIQHYLDQGIIDNEERAYRTLHYLEAQLYVD